MEPTMNGRTDISYGPPPGAENQIGTLMVERVRPGLVRSFWKPNPGELAALNNGGVVELSILGEPIPPVRLLALTVEQAEEDYRYHG